MPHVLEGWNLNHWATREVLTYSFLVIKGLLVHLTDQRIRTLDLDKPISRWQVTLEKIPALNSGTRAA